MKQTGGECLKWPPHQTRCQHQTRQWMGEADIRQLELLDSAN